MWALNNHTPFKAGSTWGRDLHGVHQWIVVVKATFEIQRDGSLRLADEQLDPLFVPEYIGDDGDSSLRYDADLTDPKPATDIVLNGTAYAPGGVPSSDFLVALRVGRVQKTLRVRGNRAWKKGVSGIRASRPQPVAEVPIVYERAFGGYDRSDPDIRNHRLDKRNPVGCGMHFRSESLIDRPLPNLEYPNGELSQAGPAGFSAIACHWSPRVELSGTYDEAWYEQRCPLLPLDWDPRSTLCSPTDQRPDDYLWGGEPVELINMTREGVLRCTLPKVFLTFSTLLDGDVKQHRGALVTVVIEPDEQRLIMVWLTSLACRTDMDYLEHTVIRLKPYA